MVHTLLTLGCEGERNGRGMKLQSPNGELLLPLHRQCVHLLVSDVNLEAEDMTLLYCKYF